MTNSDPRFGGPGPEARWTEMLADGIFAIQRCGACGAAQFPPVATCKACGAASPDMIPADGRGTVYSTTTVRAREGDHDVSIVELSEGPRLMTCVTGIAPGDVRIGMAVTARIERAADGPRVVFDAPEAT
ncbi:Zn-ribbon domain-containing OB-fold protein [Anianabacter salinae]|uniref:Zn-ribbon domain-containing OB-fold protein n=1 Tax=Anianabacter salinae TaxID=2851023 RepID=UPI00225E3CA7|nr:OB-fold domain-containing protein [Anianabacter salinae]MBV0911846.1 OB-fold domain-containing protein [Anianabacter salinae]